MSPRKPSGPRNPRGPVRPKRPSSSKSPTREDSERVLNAWGVKPDRADKRKEKADATAPARSRPDKGATPRATPRPKRSAAAPDQPRPLRKPRPRGNKPATPANPHPARAGATAGEGPQRIAKLLARAGVASRRDVERMITEGRVALNGTVLTTPATLLTSLAGVTVDGNSVAQAEQTRLFLFHKPAGFLTTARDPAGRPTIYDRLPSDLPRVMPIGRLDMNTEGLLLLTTDGGFKRMMELPANGVERSYRARAFGTVSQAQLEELIHGIEIDGVLYGRIDANLERRTGHNQWVEMTLTEGKNREVRRVLEHLGLKVNRLIRTRYGMFELADLPPGAVVEVHGSQLGAFLNSVKVVRT